MIKGIIIFKTLKCNKINIIKFIQLLKKKILYKKFKKIINQNNNKYNKSVYINKIILKNKILILVQIIKNFQMMKFKFQN